MATIFQYALKSHFNMPSIIIIWFSFYGCQTNLELFEGQTMVGKPGQSAYIIFDRTTGSYELTAAGRNIWGERDEFYFVWKKVSGDLTISADIRWIGEGNHPHRKAGVMIRQGLDDDDPYADAMVHGDGLISLQYRTEKGGLTREIQAPANSPPSLYFARHGSLYSLSLIREDGNLSPVGSLTIPLSDPVYVGVVLCSHDSSTLETAVFNNLNLKITGPVPDSSRSIESTLEILNIRTTEQKIIYQAMQHFEAPNWSPDGNALVYNSGGKLYRIPVSGGLPELIDTGEAINCNNDHGFSPDGKWLAISHSPKNQSLVYVIPSSGGKPRLITEKGPSYWHGWSPDGKTLAYCAERNNEYDIYSIPVHEGGEIRLTDAPGLDDGPDYSADGRYIYFNSVRGGRMQIWRMHTDGSEQMPITNDPEYNDWFPHPSPDGQWVAFLSYDKDVQGHPPNKNVQLRLYSTATGEIKTIAYLFGGQGTFNVPSWSPDSRFIAFVGYRLKTTDR